MFLGVIIIIVFNFNITQKGHMYENADILVIDFINTILVENKILRQPFP